MKIVPKGSICKFTINGTSKIHVSNIVVDNIVEVMGSGCYGLQEINHTVLLSIGTKLKVIKINCQQDLKYTDDGSGESRIQHDLLVIYKNTKWYVPSLFCKKMINPTANWNKFLSR